MRVAAAASVTSPLVLIVEPALIVIFSALTTRCAAARLTAPVNVTLSWPAPPSIVSETRPVAENRWLSAVGDVTSTCRSAPVVCTSKSLSVPSPWIVSVLAPVTVIGSSPT